MSYEQWLKGLGEFRMGTRRLGSGLSSCLCLKGCHMEVGSQVFCIFQSSELSAKGGNDRVNSLLNQKSSLSTYCVSGNFFKVHFPICRVGRVKRKVDTDVIRSDMRGMGEGLWAYPEDLKSMLVARRKVKEDS